MPPAEEGRVARPAPGGDQGAQPGRGVGRGGGGGGGGRRGGEAMRGGSRPPRRADFDDNLTVTPLQDTKLVKVEFTYSVPKDCKTIVYDLVSTYLEEQYKSQKSSLEDRTRVLGRLKDKASARLQALAVEKQSAQVRLNTDGSSMGRIGAKEIELSKLVGEQIDAQVKA